MYLCPSDQISRGNIDFDPSELHNMYNDDVLCTTVKKSKCETQKQSRRKNKIITLNLTIDSPEKRAQWRNVTTVSLKSASVQLTTAVSELAISSQ